MVEPEALTCLRETCQIQMSQPYQPSFGPMLSIVMCQSCHDYPCSPYLQVRLCMVRVGSDDHLGWLGQVRSVVLIRHLTGRGVSRFINCRTKFFWANDGEPKEQKWTSKTKPYQPLVFDLENSVILNMVYLTVSGDIFITFFLFKKLLDNYTCHIRVMYIFLQSCVYTEELKNFKDIRGPFKDKLCLLDYVC